MAIFQATITIWLLFIAINGGLLLMTEYGLAVCAEHPHISCGWANKLRAQGVNATNFGEGNLNIQNGTFADGFNDPTNTLVGNLTDAKNITFGNHTGNNDVLDPIIDSADYLLFNTQEIGRLVTGYCTVCNTMDTIANSGDFEWPAGSAFMIISVLGVTNVVFLLYLSSGRSV